jgi:hypothetical protein
MPSATTVAFITSWGFAVSAAGTGASVKEIWTVLHQCSLDELGEELRHGPHRGASGHESSICH